MTCPLTDSTQLTPVRVNLITRSHQPAPQLDDTSEIQSFPAPGSSSAVSDETPSPLPMTKGNHSRRLDFSHASTSSIDWDQRTSTPSTSMFCDWRNFPPLQVPYTHLSTHKTYRLDSHTNVQSLNHSLPTTLLQTPIHTQSLKQSQTLLLNQTPTTARLQTSTTTLTNSDNNSNTTFLEKNKSYFPLQDGLPPRSANGLILIASIYHLMLQV